jgi:hypothetical protein
MSRGLGALQRDLLRILEAHVPSRYRVGMSTHELAAQYYTGNPNVTYLVERAQINAVRRALNGLLRAGLVIRLGATQWPWQRVHYWLRGLKPPRR